MEGAGQAGAVPGGSICIISAEGAGVVLGAAAVPLLAAAAVGAAEAAADGWSDNPLRIHSVSPEQTPRLDTGRASSVASVSCDEASRCKHQGLAIV